MIGVGVDGTPSSRDAVVLASLLARTIGAELMLIGVHEEPLVNVVLPTEVGWTSAEKHARVTLVNTRDLLAPDALTRVQSDTFVGRALSHVARHEHRAALEVPQKVARAVPELHVWPSPREACTCGRISLGIPDVHSHDGAACPVFVISMPELAR